MDLSRQNGSENPLVSVALTGVHRKTIAHRSSLPY